MKATELQQVNWLTVHRFVAAVLNQVNDWPMLGTPAWCSLAHDDPRKWAALDTVWRPSGRFEPALPSSSSRSDGPSNSLGRGTTVARKP